MSAKDLTHRVAIQVQRVDADFASSNVDDGWRDLYYCWAGIKPNSQSDVNSFDQVDTVTSHRVKLRYDKRLGGSMRIRYGERYFSIESKINENEARRFHVLQCDEVTT